jgi:hypothetical protein
MNFWKWSNGSISKKTYIKNIKKNYENEESDEKASTFEFNKREKISDQLNNRELIINCNNNPFFKTNNYINDVFTRDKFLKPRYTSIEK